MAAVHDDLVSMVRRIELQDEDGQCDMSIKQAKKKGA